MRYGEPYIIMRVPPITWSNIVKRLDSLPLKTAKLGKKAVHNDGSEEWLKTSRDSRVGWIHDTEVLNLFFDMCPILFGGVEFELDSSTRGTKSDGKWIRREHDFELTFTNPKAAKCDHDTLGRKFWNNFFCT